MRKSVAAAAMAASLTVGGAAGAALFVPTISGAQTDDTPADDTTESEDADRPERGEFLADALAPLVEDGTIDQSQADAVIAAIQEARPEGFGHHGHRSRGFIGDALSDALGISAEENGVDIDAIVDALIAEAEAHLDTAVENGHLTEEEAAEKLADLTEHANDLVNGDFELGDHRRHRHGPFGGGDDATADEGDETTGS